MRSVGKTIVGPLLHGTPNNGKVSTIKGCSELCGTTLETFDCGIMASRSSTKKSTWNVYNSIVQGFLGRKKGLCLSNVQLLTNKQISTFANTLIDIQVAMRNGRDQHIEVNGEETYVSFESYLICTMNHHVPAITWSTSKINTNLFTSIE